ncbi:MAG: MBL fold metallo-hydrolase [Deltaproteobacteria bacterium]|nr:MBL fold metallo-hydrolase [Deltaproteobacteria bacterium]
MLISHRGKITNRIYLSFAGFLPGFIILGKKYALVDTGVPATAPALYEAITQALKEPERLEYVFLTHSHYDHCGGLSYLRRKMPNLKVVASEQTASILKKDKAIDFMNKLSKEVEDSIEFKKHFGGEDISIKKELLNVDIMVKDGDKIDLGEGVEVEVVSTPGHTRCSISFYMRPDKALFSGESVGAYAGEDIVLANYLSDYNEYMESIKKLSQLNVEFLGLPHHGMLVGEKVIKRFFELSIKGAEIFRKEVTDMIQNNIGEDEMIKRLTEKFYVDAASLQPKEAFVVNLRAMIRVIAKGLVN